MDEKGITVSYLAKIAGVKDETVWRDVKELRPIIEQEPLEGDSHVCLNPCVREVSPSKLH